MTDVTGVAIRTPSGQLELLSVSVPPAGGLPRQCSHWLAMTGVSGVKPVHIFTNIPLCGILFIIRTQREIFVSIYDRDWYWEDYERRQGKQNGSSEKRSKAEPPHWAKNKSPNKRSQNPSPPKEQELSEEKLILTSCPHCDYRFQVRVSLKRLNSFSYTCPSCNKKISVRTDTILDKKISILWFVIGAPVAFYLFMYFFLQYYL